MTLKDLIEKAKGLKKSGALAEKRTIVQVWVWQMILAALVTLGFLFADFLIYRNFVIRRGHLAADESLPATIFLKKKGLENAVKKIIEHKNFLENPKF